MTTVTKSATGAITSVFSTVTTIAEQVSGTVTAAGEGIAMLNAYVTTARTKQEARIDTDMENFFNELAEDTSDQIATRQKILAEKLNADPIYKALFEENLKKITPVIERNRNRYLISKGYKTE